jgi:AmiR/NasT family two-component response regulator
VIEQAKGIVMNENRCGPDEAFAELRACAIRSGIRLQALAEKLVAGAVRPWDDAFPRP